VSRGALRRVALAAALAGAAACLDATSPGGILKVTLATPTPTPGADGAILLTVTGPTALTSVAAVAGLRVFAEPLSTTNRFAVTGPLPNGVLLTIGVRDVTRASQYVATIQDVAAATTYQLRALAGYSLTISR
jgi:hypothetical protein